MKPSPWKIPLNFLLVLLGFFGLLFTALLLVVMAFFYSPTLFINPETLDYALKQTSVLKSWSWKEAQINHQWVAWNKRRFSGGFDHLCFVYDGPDVNVDTCLDKVSWNVELSWRPDEGFRYVIYEPLVVESSKLVITPKDNQEETPPPDIMKYWGILWSPLIPDVQITLKKVDILKKEKPLSFDLKLVKESQLMTGEALGFSLYATEKKIVISAPKRIQVPYDLKTTNPLYFSHIKLEADILETHIPILLSARVETAEFKMKTDIRRASLRDDLGTPKFVKDVAAATTAELTVGKLKETIYRLARPPFNVLPAPINSMEGQLRLRLICENYTQKDSIQLKLRTELEMTGPKQELNFALNSEIPVMLKDYSFGPITLGLELKKVRLLLPKLSRTKLPPQLIPDSRFKNSSVIVRENLNEQNLPKKVRKTPKQNVDINMHLVALGEKSLHINTNLLDETLKINFDLLIENGEVKKGYVQTFPLTTTIFKRKIVIPSLRVIFNAPLEPQIVAAIEFHLPEYKVKLDLEGPMSNPRQAFSSVPPLPIDDIYSVILFGRPLSGLDPDDRSAAKKSNQILSQGILSLAVLYYFAGSPVESIGYDPSSNELSAQIGLGSKNSLRVGGSGSGLNSAGVRRSLGKGWYIDSSVQRTTRDNGTSGQDYGVLLERIISY